MTRSPVWLAMGRDMVSSLQALSRVGCGYASIANVTSNVKRDWMDSFFLSETLKYLYLLFAETEAGVEDTRRWVVDGEDTIFTTEAHPISRRRLQVLQVPTTNHVSRIEVHELAMTEEEERSSEAVSHDHRNYSLLNERRLPTSRHKDDLHRNESVRPMICGIARCFI